MIVEIQCLPRPAGTPQEPYRHVDAAIKAIQDSGLRHEVGALGTTIEGTPDQLWPLLRAVHEACIAAGAESAVSVIKIAQAPDHDGEGAMQSLTAKFREQGSA